VSTNKKNVASKNTAQKKSLPIWIWIGLGIVLLAFLAAALLMRPASKAETLPPEISVAQAAEKRSTGAFILDVREQDEWDEIHIPDATLIPLGQLEGRLSEVPRDQEVVVVCRSGNRSKTGRDLLLQAGFKNVTSMAGGMKEWQAQGFPTASGR
jgi:rhodanese-related sulfurtransferase